MLLDGLLSKKCKKCEKVKLEEEFYKRGKYLSSYCKECEKEKAIKWYRSNRDRSLAYKKNWYLSNLDKCRKWERDNREKRAGYTRASAKKGRAFVDNLKDNPCMDCGIKYPPYIMQFDHVRGTKKYNVSLTLCHSKKSILEEVAKCDLVCANCHAERTYQRILESKR
jgi:hypothetical protein